MKLSIPSISVDSSPSEIAKSIEGSEHGVLTLTGLPAAPFEEILAAFDHLSSHQDLTTRLNEAYQKNLIYKDAFANNNGGPTIDMKRVLDLSPERLEEITRNDPSLATLQQEGALGATLAYWEHLRSSVAPKIVDAVAQAVGCPTVKEDAAFNYRMVDYYERDSASIPPRCGEHRDFGSFTLVFPSHNGLQIFVNDEWKDVELPGPESAIMLFGWCTQIRSNGRIPAALHRVTDPQPAATTTTTTLTVPRRVAAVLFCAPKMAETPLEPVVRPGEDRVYISGVKAGQLRGKMARKWQAREGTIKVDDRILEEAEILATNMLTQDDVVQKTISA